MTDSTIDSKYLHVANGYQYVRYVTQSEMIAFHTVTDPAYTKKIDYTVMSGPQIPISNPGRFFVLLSLKNKRSNCSNV